MIQITCPNCQSKLNAKEKLIGQTRNCPKCKTPVLIKAPEAEAASSPDDAPTSDETPTIHVEPPQEGEGLAKVKTVAEPTSQLKSPNKYVICDRQRIVAVWEGDGTGWQLATAAGPISAKRNTEQIPSQGNFRLIELRIDRSDAGTYLTGIVAHELTPRWALPAIARGDNQILEKIVGPSGLTRDQKQMVRRYLQDTFMPDVWRHREEITEFLSSDDIHTQGVV